MGDNTVDNGQVTNATINEEKQISGGAARSHGIALKAPKTNVGVVWIGVAGKAKSSNGGYPLAAGESIALDVKNAQNLSYSVDTANDKLNWLTLGP
jgi:hypothetical protein